MSKLAYFFCFRKFNKLEKKTLNSGNEENNRTLSIKMVGFGQTFNIFFPEDLNIERKASPCISLVIKDTQD